MFFQVKIQPYIISSEYDLMHIPNDYHYSIFIKIIQLSNTDSFAKSDGNFYNAIIYTINFQPEDPSWNIQINVDAEGSIRFIRWLFFMKRTNQRKKVRFPVEQKALQGFSSGNQFVSTIADIFSQPLNSIGSTGVRQLILVRLEVRAKLDFVSAEMTTGHLWPLFLARSR